jgi:type II secretion system (T2SS) protein M
VVAPVDSVERAEKRLEILKRAAATVPGKEGVLAHVSNELAKRETGLIAADTAAQAQAQLLQTIKRVARTEGLEIRQVELGRPQPFADAYGEVMVSVSSDCQIDQLVNLMADLTAQPEIAATSEIRVGLANAKKKTMPVRLTISGIVPRKLVPEKKGLAAF